MDPATITATIAAVASSIGLLVTSLRKRQDTTYEELKSKIEDQQADIDRLESDLDREQERRREREEDLRKEQDHNVAKDRTISTLRRELAKAGIDDPTVKNVQGA